MGGLGRAGKGLATPYYGHIPRPLWFRSGRCQFGGIRQRHRISDARRPTHDRPEDRTRSLTDREGRGSCRGSRQCRRPGRVWHLGCVAWAAARSRAEGDVGLGSGQTARRISFELEAEHIDLGNEPPLSVDGETTGLVDRRRVSVQWFSGTILTGLCGAALMGGAVFASLDGETNFATVPERVEAALRGAVGGIGERIANATRKADRLPPPGETNAARQVIRVTTTSAASATARSCACARSCAWPAIFRSRCPSSPPTSRRSIR